MTDDKGEKKGLLDRLMGKLDKSLEEKSKQKSCSCCSCDEDTKDKGCCD